MVNGPREKVPVYPPYALTPARKEWTKKLVVQGRKALMASGVMGGPPPAFTFLSTREIASGPDVTLDWRRDFIEAQNAADGYPQPVFVE